MSILDVIFEYFHSSDLKIEVSTAISSTDCVAQHEMIITAIIAAFSSQQLHIRFQPASWFIVTLKSGKIIKLGTELITEATFSLQWACKVTVYQKGDKMSLPLRRSSKKEKAVTTMEYLSKDPITLIKAAVDYDNKAKMVVLLPDGKALKDTHMVLVVEPLLELFCIPAKTAYSSSQVQQLTEIVEMPADDLLNSFPLHDSLPNAIKGIDAMIANDQANWKRFMDVALFKLDCLSRQIPPNTVFPEAARRLVINEVVSCVCCATHAQYAVEKHQEGSVGQGLLDYLLFTGEQAHGGLLVGSTHATAKEAEGDEEEGDEDDDEEDDEAVHLAKRKKIATISKLVDIEAKAEFTQRHLAQLLCQLYDAVHSDSTKTAMTGVLSTGHRFRFYTLHRADQGEHKARVVFHGELIMRVLCYDSISDRESGLKEPLPTPRISEEEVRSVVKAMVAAVRGDLTKA